MNDLEFQDQLSRFADFLGSLKKPAQRTKASLHPDLGRATERVQRAALAAKALMGSGDGARYEEILVELRRAVGAWQSVNDGHGTITWKPGDTIELAMPVAPRRATVSVE